MNSYLDLLNNQYHESLGIDSLYDNSDMYEFDFLVWLSEIKRLSQNYLSILDNLGLHYDDGKCIEIGKGFLDSAVLGKKTTILTTFTGNIKDKNTIIEGKLKTYKNSLIIFKNLENIINIQHINFEHYNMLMTHNPYNISDVNNWVRFHNNNDLGIIIGMYGFLKDKDRKEKILTLKNLKDKLYDNSYYFENTTIGDAYFAVLGSKVKK